MQTKSAVCCIQQSEVGSHLIHTQITCSSTIVHEWSEVFSTRIIRTALDIAKRRLVPPHTNFDPTESHCNGGTRSEHEHETKQKSHAGPAYAMLAASNTKVTQGIRQRRQAWHGARPKSNFWNKHVAPFENVHSTISISILKNHKTEETTPLKTWQFGLPLQCSYPYPRYKRGVGTSAAELL